MSTLQNNIEEAKKRFELFTQDYEDVFNQYVCCSGGIKGDVDCACNGLLWKDKIEDYLISELTSIATLAQEEARKEYCICLKGTVADKYSEKICPVHGQKIEKSQNGSNLRAVMGRQENCTTNGKQCNCNASAYTVKSTRYGTRKICNKCGVGYTEATKTQDSLSSEGERKPEWEKEFDKRFPVDTFDFSENSHLIKRFICEVIVTQSKVRAVPATTSHLCNFAPDGDNCSICGKVNKSL